MKRMLVCAAALVFAVAAVADESAAIVVRSTNGVASYSSAIDVSGWLDRVEIVKSGDTGTCDIVIGTYSSTTALEKFVNISALAEGTDTVVLRPRAVGTVLTSGTAITAVTGTAVGTNTTTMLVAPYERMMVGGNLKLCVTSTTNAVITAKLFYERSPK